MRNLILTVLCCAASGAFAQSSTKEYRIDADKIAGISFPVVEVEDPLTILVTFLDGSDFMIESDLLLDECAANITAAMDIAAAEVVIRVDEAADTMNGIVVTDCFAERP